MMMMFLIRKDFTLSSIQEEACVNRLSRKTQKKHTWSERIQERFSSPGAGGLVLGSQIWMEGLGLGAADSTTGSEVQKLNESWVNMSRQWW